MTVVVGVLKETAANETRVALVPEIAAKLKALGARVLIERGAGVLAHFPDAAYADAEMSDASTILSSADVLLCVQPPSIAIVDGVKQGAVVVGYMQAYARPDLVRALKEPPRHELRDGAGAAHLARAVDGRALLPGLGRRLQGRAHRGRFAREVHADADHRGGYDQARVGSGHRRGRGGLAGHRHGQASGRRGRGV